MNNANLILLSLVLARVGGLTMTAPIYGTSDVPMRVRLLLTAALAMLLMPTQWHDAVPMPGGAIELAVLLGGEAMIGACLGFGVLILIHGMTLAGGLVGQAGGLSLSDVFDPMFDESVPQFSRLMFLVTLAVFFCIGGHRMVMAGLLGTFQAIPPGSAINAGSLGAVFVTLMSQSFSLAVRAAAPAITALLLSTVILALVGRTLPQLNILTLGFGVNSLLAFAAVALTLGAAVWAFEDQIEPAIGAVLEALKTPRLSSLIPNP